MWKTLQQFLNTYASGENTRRVVLDLDLTGLGDEDHDPNEPTPYIILRHRGRTLVLNPMAFEDHFCVDAHAFVDGQAARASAFGMDDGARLQFEEAKAKGTSHGWPAAALVSVLVGKQKDA